MVTGTPPGVRIVSFKGTSCLGRVRGGLFFLESRLSTHHREALQGEAGKAADYSRKAVADSCRTPLGSSLGVGTLSSSRVVPVRNQQHHVGACER